MDASCLEKLMARGPIDADDMCRMGGLAPTYILIDGLLTQLAAERLQAQAKAQADQQAAGILESLIKWFRGSQPPAEIDGWAEWGAGYEFRREVTAAAGWEYVESHYPQEEAAQAYERIRQALLSPECSTAEDLLRLVRLSADPLRP